MRRSTTGKTHSPDGSLTTSEMDRRAQAFLDAQPTRTTCALCGQIVHDGPAGTGRIEFVRHLQAEHPDFRPVKHRRKGSAEQRAHHMRLAAERAESLEKIA